MTKKNKSKDTESIEEKIAEKESNKIEFKLFSLSIKATMLQLLILLFFVFASTVFMFNIDISFHIGDAKISLKPIKIKKHKDSLQVGADKLMMVDKSKEINKVR